MKRFLWIILWGIITQKALAAPDSTMSITPSAVAGTTITAADENARNSAISTPYNAHDHTDISKTANTLNIGNGTAGNKQICSDAVTDRCFRWDDTANLWLAQQVGTTYGEIAVHSGTAGLTTGGVLFGNATAGFYASNVLTNGQLLIGDGANEPTLATLTAGNSITVTNGAGSITLAVTDISARAYNSAALSLTSGTATVLTLDSERWDTDTIHSTASNTSRLTATTAGKYQITGHVEFATTANTGQRLLEILLNGATVIASQTCGQTPDDAARAITCSISAHYNLAATNYVELRATQRAVSSLNINASGNYSPEFEMVKVP